MKIFRAIPILLAINMLWAEEKKPIAYSSQLPHYSERWGPMAETSGKLYIAAGNGILRFDLETNRWKVLVPPQNDAEIHLFAAATDAKSVYFCGFRGKVRSPIIWKIAVNSGKLTQLPIAEAFERAELSKYNGIRDIAVSGGRLWLSVSRDDYNEVLLDCALDGSDLRRAPELTPPDIIIVGWTDHLLADGDSISLLGYRGKQGETLVLWRLDTVNRKWTHTKLPVSKGERAVLGALRRPGEAWALTLKMGLVSVSADDRVSYAPPEKEVEGYSYHPVFLGGGKVLMFWGRGPDEKVVPFAYEPELKRWTIGKLPAGQKHLNGHGGRFFPGARGAWLTDNYTLYHIPTSEIERILQRKDRERALAMYFEGPWTTLTIGEAERAELARSRKVQSLGTGIVEAEDAMLYEKKNGRAIEAVPFGTGLFLFKRLYGGGNTGMANPNEAPDLDPWEPVMLANGKRGWMRGEKLVLWKLRSVAAQASEGKLTVQTGPTFDSAQAKTILSTALMPVTDLVEVQATKDDAKARLWVRLDRIAPGNPPLSGWVPADSVQFNFAQLQRDAAVHWAGAWQNINWKGKNNDRDRAFKLLSQISKDKVGTMVLHPGIFDGGGPRQCDAGYQARFDMAGSSEPEQALKIYGDLEKADRQAKVYPGTVPASAALRRADLLHRLKRYDEALVAYRTVLTRFAGEFYPNGMYGLGDSTALWGIKRIYLEVRKDPKGWTAELERLKKMIKDERLLKELTQMIEQAKGQ